MVLDEKAVFVSALALPDASERDAYLQEACAGRPELLGRLRELLSAHEESQGPLDRGPAALRVTLDAAHTEVPGTMIGSYKLLQKIGEGGMGVVWMAEQTEPVKRKVALKVIKPGMDSQQVIARFEAERQALAMMDHVNIARVFDGGTTGEPSRVSDRVESAKATRLLTQLGSPGRPFFVMELVHGVPITKYCDDNHLTPRERLELFVPVCQAIQHAHQKGIIHRDIKPSNVMVTLYDGKPVPKVIDFGVAKATEQKLTERTLFTQYGTMVGTLEYMSPEQAEMSALGVDTRSDIYSLGVLLYELLTGTTPLDRKRMKEAAFGEILRMIKEEEPPRPSTRLSDSGEALASISANRHTEPAKLTKLVKGELDWIVMKCLEKERNRRYETANGFAMDVQRYLADEPVLACPPSAVYRLRKFVRRNKGPVLAATLIVVALVIGIIGATWGLIRATEAEADAVAEAKQKEQERDKAVNAERDARHRLFEAKLAEAKASRRSREPGQRFDSWTAIAKAAALARELDLNEGFLQTLRSEAIACLALPDVKLLKQWPGWPSGSSAGLAFDARLERYARSDLKWNVSVRSVDDDRQLALFSNPGPSSAGAGAASMAFSPNGALLAVRYWYPLPGHATNFQLLDWQSGKVVFQASFPVGQDSWGCSPDGRHLALAQDDGTLTLHEAVTGKELSRINVGVRPSHLAFSPDGARLAIGGPGQIQIREIAGGALVSTLRHDAAVVYLAWHPDGLMLGAACADSTIYLWDSVTAARHAILRGHHGGGVKLSFSPSGSTLLSSGWDGASRLWDPWSGLELLRFPGNAIQFSADGRRLVNCVGSNFSLWAVTEAQECRTLPRSQNLGAENFDRVRGSFSRDGRWLAVPSTQGIRIWDISRAKEVAALPISSGVCFHPKEYRFFTPDISGLYDWPIVESASALRVGPARKLAAASIMGQVSLDRAGNMLAAAGNHAGWIFDLRRPERAVRQVAHHDVASSAISPDGKWLATGTWGGYGVKIWETATGRELVVLNPEERSAWVAFSPDGRWLVIGRNNTYSIWATPAGDQAPDTVASWKLQHEISTASQLGNIAFSPDGKLLAIMLSPSVAQLLDPATGQAFAKVAAPDTYTWAPSCFSSTHLVMVTAAGPGAVRVWDLRRIRANLHEISLDWDATPDLPADVSGAAKPLRVQVDLGDYQLWRDLLTGQDNRHRFTETKHEGSLTSQNPRPVRVVEMTAGKTYVLDLSSKAFDTLLVLEDSSGTLLAENDDIEVGNLNSRIIFTAPTTGSYRMIATPFVPGATGPYTLRIREVVDQK